MRRPLFIKIFLGVWLSFLFVTYFVWFEDSLLKQSPSRTTAVAAQIALSGAASAIRLGGEEGGQRRFPGAEHDQRRAVAFLAQTAA